ncbi:MAG: DNA translocase FtsK [Dehalococcoidia bacterium]
MQFWASDKFRISCARACATSRRRRRRRKRRRTRRKTRCSTRAQELARWRHTRISSISWRRLRVGYPRAARLMDLLEAEGLVGTAEARLTLRGSSATPALPRSGRACTATLRPQVAIDAPCPRS